MSSRRGPGATRSAHSPKGEDERVLTLGWRLRLTPRAVRVERDLELLDDAPERSGSENRHDDVRESEWQ
jgi:hypothetical protein